MKRGGPTIAILIALALFGFAQQPPPSYVYSIVFDNVAPVAGEEVIDILALDVSDEGDIAVLAQFGYRKGIWVKSKNAWIVRSGDPLAAGGIESISGIGAPSFGADGSVRYCAESNAGGIHKIAYMAGDKLIYKTSNQVAAAALDGFFLRDSVIVPSDPPIVGSTAGPQPLMPSDSGVRLVGANPVAVSRTSGRYAFLGQVVDNNGRYLKPGIYLNQSLRLPTVPQPVADDFALFLNGHDDIAFGLFSKPGMPIFVNGVPTATRGRLFGFNDAKDLLYVTGIDHESVFVNNTLVIEVGNEGEYGVKKTRLGTPQIGNRGFVLGYMFPKMNNQRQVAFAVQFVPVGARVVATTRPTINGVRIPWEVVLGTPRH